MGGPALSKSGSQASNRRSKFVVTKRVTPRVVRVPEGEDAAANALRVNDVVLVGAAFPRTAEALDRLGYRVVPLHVAETGKLDAGLSCMSLRWGTS